LQINGEKMSKSLNNFFTIREVLEKYDAELVRYFMMSGHYRSPVNYSEDNLSQLQSGLDRFYLALRDLPDVPEAKTKFEDQFNEAMDDDFNTPVAMSVLFDMAHEIQRLREQDDMQTAGKLGKTLVRLAKIFGIVQRDPNDYFQGKLDSKDVEKIEALIAERDQARADKDWNRADKVRDKLTNLGVVIEDSAQGTTWRTV